MNKKIQEKIEYLTRKFGTNDPMELACCLNIKVLFVPMGKIAGFYIYMKHRRCIYINLEIENISFMRVVIAHELGHAIFHPKENCTFMASHTLLLTSKIERQANLFAAHLLITDELLNEFEEYTQEQFCNSTGYPMELLKLKLN